MPKHPWAKIKAAYQKGEGSCREIAEKWGINRHTVEARCKREGWNREKSEIAQKVTEKVVEVLADRATAWVEQTIKDSLDHRNLLRSTIDQAKEGDEYSPSIDPGQFLCLMKADSIIDDRARRAFGIPDAPAKADVSLTVINVINPFTDEPKNG